MATLSAKPSFTPGYRHQATANAINQAANTTTSSYHADVASPTNSDFSMAEDDDEYEEDDDVRDWDIKEVANWLKSINAGQYIDLFRTHDITGENLMDLDQSMLKEMGIKKIGDRVRIGAQAKQFRYGEYRRRREYVRSSTPAQNSQVPTPPSSESPRQTARLATRYANGVSQASSQGASRPTSPLHTIGEARTVTSTRLNAYSPREIQIPLREQPSATFAQRTEAARLGANAKSQNSRFADPQSKAVSLVVDTDIANGIPRERNWIRAIFDNSRSAVLSIEGCKTVEDVVRKTLRKGHLNESHVKSYCFWFLDGVAPDPLHCRRLSDAEVLRVCADPNRIERERLIFRKIHAGEPEGAQLETAASIALAQLQRDREPVSAASVNSLGTASRSQAKVQRLTGESLPPLSYPMSPASAAERERHLQDAARGLESGEGHVLPRPRFRKSGELPGERPDSELVINDPKQYFPDVSEEKFEQMRRMSIRRSQRLSRATSRLSIASNISYTSSLDDAPPLPRIADSMWYNQQHAVPRARPLSIARPLSQYRNSFTSSMLDPLDEESPSEPNRKSYISFAGDDTEPNSATSSVPINIIDEDGNTVQKTDYYASENGSSPPNTEHEGSIGEQLTHMIAEDGEEEDDELTKFLRPDAWENIPYIRGKLIGQGSFGSVYLALHATTAELMAVKQVELPSTEGSAVDAKKNNMVEALKREIGLLRELKHKNIVHYLGSSSEASHLNIFLEYVPGGSIAKMLVDYGSLNEGIITGFVRQILVGLAYLHSKDIIHRDIKGANILVDTAGAVKISDFGISKRVQDSKAALSETGPGGTRRGRGIAANRVSLQGSVFWMAPEVVKQTAYTRKADIWSLGCLIVEMFTGSHPHPDLSQLQAIFKIGGNGADPAPTLPEVASAAAKEFLKQTFLIEHEQRPEAQQLLQMAFVKEK